MILIVSSKALARFLSEIDFDCEWITSVTAKNNTVTLHVSGNVVRGQSTIKTVQFKADVKDEVILPHEARWDWVKQFCNKVSEQPLVMGIGEKGVKISVNY